MAPSAISTNSSKVISTNGTTGIAAPGRQTYKIASIPADGIGPEVISAGITVLEKLVKELGTFEMEFEHFDWSSERYKREGKYLPDNALDVVRGFDAILFGAVGAPGTCFLFAFPFSFFQCGVENVADSLKQMYQTTSPSGVSA